MNFLYVVLGAIIMAAAYFISKPTGKVISKIKLHRVHSSDMKQLKDEIDGLRNTLKEVVTEINQLREVNNETQKTNTMLFPEHFELDKTEGKTVFVKDGEEKPYATIDWRSR
jgi:uncharacterized coiled-coil DUF342 family protein